MTDRGACQQVILYFGLQNVEYLDALGAVHAEVGQQEEAVRVLQRAVQLEPDRGFTKYM